MAEYAQFLPDEVERRRREQAARAHFIRSPDAPANVAPVYSDTDPGPRGDFTTAPQQGATPKFNPAQPTVRPETETLPTFNPGAAPTVTASAGGPAAPNAPATPAFHPVYSPKGGLTGVEGTGTDLEKKEAYLRELMNYKPKSHNSRLKSMAIGAGRGYMQGGLLGAIFGAVTHAVDPSQDEKYSRRQKMGELSGEIKQQLGTMKEESVLADQATERDYKRAVIKRETLAEQDKKDKEERDAALKNLEQYDKLDEANPVHARAIARARKSGWAIDPKTWGKKNVQVAFDQNTGTGVQRNPLTGNWEPMRDEKGNPISTHMPGDRGDLEKEMMIDPWGIAEPDIRSEAVKQTRTPKYATKADFDPVKIDLYRLKGDAANPTETDDQVIERARAGQSGVRISDLVKNSDKAEAVQYEQRIASSEQGLRQRHNLWTLAAREAQRSKAGGLDMPTEQFRHDFKKFYETYSNAKTDAEKEQVRNEYFNYIKSLRLK